jgi:LEA14-like dessication related protein
MLKKYLLIGGITAAVIGTALYYRRQFSVFYNFKYKVTSLQTISKSKDLLKLRATIEIDNPSQLQFTLSSYNFDVLLNRTNRVGKISNSDVNQTLMRNGKSYITFDIDILLKDINWVSTGIDLLLGGKNSLLTLNGNLVVKSGILFFRVPLDLSYSFKYILG